MKLVTSAGGFPRHYKAATLLAAVFFICIPFSGLLASAYSGRIALEPVWEKNLPDFNLVAPFSGAVADDGTICIARKQGQEAVMLNRDGARIATLRGGPAGRFELVSVAAIGYEPTGQFFWIWSDVVHRLTRWRIDGKFLGATRADPGLDQLMIHGERKIYVRRPDQGSQHSVFSYHAALDEEIMLWQPGAGEGRVVPDGQYVTFALGRHYLGVRDSRQLTLVNLDELEEPFSMPLPDEWFTGPPTKVGDIEIVTQSDHKVDTPILAGSNDRFWVFRTSPGGIGCRFALYDAPEGVPVASGILEDIPLMVDREHLFFIDLEDANTQILRKVAFTLQ